MIMILIISPSFEFYSDYLSLDLKDIYGSAGPGWGKSGQMSVLDLKLEADTER